MSSGMSGWGHVNLAEKLGREARKGGCGNAEIRWGSERKSYSGAGLVLGLGRGLGPETRQVDCVTGHGRGQETECRRKELKGIGVKVLCWDRKDRRACMRPGTLQPPQLEWDLRGLCADATAVCKYLSDLFFMARHKTVLSASFVFENLSELE